MNWLQGESAAKPAEHIWAPPCRRVDPRRRLHEGRLRPRHAGRRGRERVDPLPRVNAQRGTSRRTGTRRGRCGASSFKRRRDKQPAKGHRASRCRMARRSWPNEKQWDGAAKLFAQNGRGRSDYGPEPTSPACRCPLTPGAVPPQSAGSIPGAGCGCPGVGMSEAAKGCHRASSCQMALRSCRQKCSWKVQFR